MKSHIIAFSLIPATAHSQVHCDNTPQFANLVVHPTNSVDVPYGNPASAANGARGYGDSAQSTDVFSLNHSPDGSIVLAWSDRTLCNTEGYDFAVFENVFLSSLSEQWFLEPVVVSVSYDGSHFEDFPHKYSGPTDGSNNAADWQGFAGILPHQYNEDTFNFSENGIHPVSSPNSGGNPFDLGDLPNSELGESLKRSGIRYIKLTAAQKFGFPNTPNNLDGGYADIDAVYGSSFSID